MPVSEESRTEPQNYRQKYRNLKRKLKFLIYENECFQEELRKAQRKLLKVSRDKSFLLDRLLQHERVEESSSDSDATVSSDSDIETHKLEGQPPKKKKTVSASGALIRKYCKQNTKGSKVSPQGMNADAAPKRKKTTPKTQKHGSGKSSVPPEATAPLVLGDGHMTSEEIERHLESRQSLLDLLPERAPLTVPTEMFSNDPSSLDSCPNLSSDNLANGRPEKIQRRQGKAASSNDQTSGWKAAQPGTEHAWNQSVKLTSTI